MIVHRLPRAITNRMLWTSIGRSEEAAIDQRKGKKGKRKGKLAQRMHQGRKNRSGNRHERMSSQQSWRWPSSLSPRMAINALITVCCSLLLVIHFLWRPVGLPAGLPGRTGTLLWPPRGFVALRDGSLSKCSDDVCFPFSWSNFLFWNCFFRPPTVSSYVVARWFWTSGLGFRVLACFWDFYDCLVEIEAVYDFTWFRRGWKTGGGKQWFKEVEECMGSFACDFNLVEFAGFFTSSLGMTPQLIVYGNHDTKSIFFSGQCEEFGNVTSSSD